MRIRPEEPAIDAWQAMSIDGLADRLGELAGDPDGRPRIVAIDGRGASGKSTLADALDGVLHGCAIVHTDDLAWHEPFFGWGHLLAEVLTELHSGAGLSFRPPAWLERGREGRIEVPADAAW